MRRGAGYMFLESGLFKETVFQEEAEYEKWSLKEKTYFLLIFYFLAVVCIL
jgi:hypothetical protein